MKIVQFVDWPRRPHLADRVFKRAQDGEEGTLRQTLGRVSGVFVFVLSLFGLCSQTSLFKWPTYANLCGGGFIGNYWAAFFSVWSRRGFPASRAGVAGPEFSPLGATNQLRPC